jgi:hypothetical protein
MAQVIMPPKKENGFGQILPIAGAVVGGIFGGGPAGAATGYSLGGAASNILSSNQSQQQPLQTSGALQRRQDQLNQPDNLTALRNAEQAAAYLPERQRQSYLPAIVTARRLEEQQRGMV